MKNTLDHRKCIVITGDDRFNFLQAIISNDINLLNSQPAIYACILTPQGKYFADIFIINFEDYFLVDIPEEVHEELMLKLSMYKLRSKVDITLANDIKVVASNEIFKNFDKEVIYITDPRNKDLGFRYYIVDKNLCYIDDLENSTKAYDLKRINLGIPEGEKDLIRGKSFPLEYELDKLNAFSFTKGCYVGQEVVSRTKYMGVIRKKIYKIEANKPLKSKEEIIVNDKKIGVICSTVDNVGLALLYKEAYSESIEKEVKTDAGYNLIMIEL